MAIWSRLKSLAGGKGALTTLASATALPIPSDDNAFLVSGTTTVSSLSMPTHLYNRRITLVGAASAAVSFTNTNSPSAGQMHLQGSNRLLQEDDVLELLVKNDGTITLINFTG